MARGVSVRTAVILAGGLGLRLRPLTDRTPKVMVNIYGKTIADWQVDWLESLGVKRVVFAAGHLWEKIRDHFESSKCRVRVDYSIEAKPLGTGGALKRASEFIYEGNFVVLNGDIVTDLNLKEMLDLHLRLEAKGTILIVPFVSPYGLVEATPKGKVRCFTEKPAIPNAYINGGVYILSKGVIDMLPKQGDLEKTTFPKLAEEGSLAAFPHGGFWRSVDTMKDLVALEGEMRSRFPSRSLRMDA